MTCRQTRRERVLVSHAAPARQGHDRDLLPRRASSRRSRRRGGRCRRHHRSRGPRGAPLGHRAPGRRRDCSPPELLWTSSRSPRSASWRMPPARSSCRRSSRSRWRSFSRPARTARTSRPVRASHWASPAVRRTVPRHPRLDRGARPPDPGRPVGMTTDLDGQRAFVMTMRAREQDIRRDKAASNICTNQALLALGGSIYLATIGPHGCVTRRDGAARAASRGGARRGRSAAPAPGPVPNEFAVRSRTRGRSTAACSTAGSLPGSPSRRADDRRSPMRSSCAPPS